MARPRVTLGEELRLVEKEVEAQGDELMERLGFEVIRFSQPRNTMQTPGIADRLYVHPARRLAVWWEAKALGGKQSAAQHQFEELVTSVGQHYVLGGVEALRDWFVSFR